MPLVYEQFRGRARQYMRWERPDHTLYTTDPEHEAYLQMERTDTFLEDCAHFMAIAAMTVRHIPVNHAKAAQRVKRGGLKKVLATINVDEALLVQSDPADILDLNAALGRLAQREIGDGTGRRLSNMLR